jgi:hypothetical protein
MLSGRIGDRFDRHIRDRGLNYYRDGLVGSPTFGPESVTVFVRGSEKYSVRVDWSRVDRNNEISIDCSCPHFTGGAFCKHSWAVILYLDDEGISDEVPGVNRLRVTRPKPIHQNNQNPNQNPNQNQNQNRNRNQQNQQGDRQGGDRQGGNRQNNRQDNRQDNKKNRRGRDRDRDHGPSNGPKNGPVEPSEHDRRPNDRDHEIDMLGPDRPRGAPERPVAPTQPINTTLPRIAFYILDLIASQTRGEAVIQFYHQSVLAGGRPGAIQPAPVSRSDFPLYPSPQDREYLGMLLAGTGVMTTYANSHVAQSNAGVPAAMNEIILGRLAQSGRLYCSPRFGGNFHLGAEAIPLRFDEGEPYRLVASVIKRNSNYHLEGFLQRGDERIPSRPTLPSRAGKRRRPARGSAHFQSALPAHRVAARAPLA